LLFNCGKKELEPMGWPIPPSARKFYAYSAILGIIGFLSLLLITRHGIGINVDSVTYIGGAKNLLDGKGFSAYTFSDDGINTPITRFPPLFSIIIAFTGYFNNNLVANIRLINSLLFGANIILVGFILNKATNGSFWFSILGSFIMLTSTSLLDIHSFAYTEPVSILLSTLGLFLLCNYIESSNKLILAISAFSNSLALLARYAALPCIIAGIIAIYALGKSNYYKKFKDSLFYLIISVLPITIWVVRNLYISGDVTGRKVSYHLIGLGFFKSCLSVFSIWLFNSDHISVYIRIAVLLGFITAFIILIYPKYNKIFLEKDNSNTNATRSYAIIPSLFLIYCICYLLFIFISKSFIDFYIPIDSRVLSPLFGPFLVIFLYSIASIFHGHNIIVRYALLIFCITFAINYMVQGFRWTLNVQKDGLGYNSIVWKKSDTLIGIRGIVSKRIYSNAWDVIYFIDDKRCYRIPYKYDPTSMMHNKKYANQMIVLRNDFEKRKAVLVWINKLSWRQYLPSKEELIRELNLKLIKKYNDGSLYGIN
jgi:hypothetical protein